MSEVTPTILPDPYGRPVLSAANALALAAVVLASCAVPMAPTGGPPDRKPPGIESVEPPNGAVNVATSVVRITFDEYITESSFQQALSITPEPPERPEMRFKKRTVEIKFRQTPEPNTTYILTIDTKLRDNRGVNLKAPITIAFSTGPEINRGTIRGRVLSPVRGDGAAGIQVFAYPLSDSASLDSLPDRPLYRTETDADGEFHFEYLSARPYFVLAVRDRNSNRRPDDQEVIAVPPVLAVFADSAGTPIESPWITTLLDTIAPQIRRVEAITSTRLSLRYSEDVHAVPQAEEWSMSDTLAQQYFPIQFAYRLPGDRRQVFLQTAGLRLGTYTLLPAAVRDSVGNAALSSPVRFSIVSPAEDEPPRFVNFIPPSPTDGAPLHPSISAGVVFDRPVTPEQVREWIAVEDSAGNALTYTITSPDGVRQLLSLDQSGTGVPFHVRVLAAAPVSADSTDQRTYSFLTERQLGGIVGVIARTSVDTALVVEALKPGTPDVAASVLVGPSGQFAVSRLAEGTYSLRVARDDNGNGRWDGGSILPYQPAEPLFWKTDSLRVRARWDTDLDTLRIPLF